MKWFQEFLLPNWGLKVASLSLAFVLWLAVNGDRSGDARTMSIPLEIHNVPRNMMITNDRVSSVEVTVRGPIGSFWTWGPSPTAVIDLRAADEGERVIPLSAENIRMPRGPGLQVISVAPPRVRLVLERTASKEVPVRAAIDGEIPVGYERYSVTLTPATALLTGPKSRIERIREVTTETVSIDGAREPVRVFVHLNILDPLVQSSQVRPVEVVVEIGERRKVRTVSEVPLMTDDETLTVSPPRIALQLLVPPAFKGSLAPSDFVATVSARDLGPQASQGRVRPDVRPTSGLAPGVSIKAAIPSAVTVYRSGGGK
jgi:YbbR domain-containing protein